MQPSLFFLIKIVLLLSLISCHQYLCSRFSVHCQFVTKREGVMCSMHFCFLFFKVSKLFIYEISIIPIFLNLRAKLVSSQGFLIINKPSLYITTSSGHMFKQ